MKNFFLGLLIGLSFVAIPVLAAPVKSLAYVTVDIFKKLETKVDGNGAKLDKFLAKDLPLLQFNDAIDSTDRSINTLSNMVYNNTYDVCKSIVANKTTRAHLYYHTHDQFDKVKEKYKNFNIPTIKIALETDENVLQEIVDKCASEGYIVSSR